MGVTRPPVQVVVSGLQGIVSKRRDAPYRSGECRDWRKVKTFAWREVNRERWRLFERSVQPRHRCRHNSSDR